MNFIEQMGRELEEVLRQQVAQPANSCLSESGVSFIDQVICPLYGVICAVCLSNLNSCCFSLLLKILSCWVLDVNFLFLYSIMISLFFKEKRLTYLIDRLLIFDPKEAANNDNGRAPHSSWRNYDDFNEYFW